MSLRWQGAFLIIVLIENVSLLIYFCSSISWKSEDEKQKFVGFRSNLGRLGNQLFHLCTGYGIARRMGRTHYFNYATLNKNVTMAWIRKTIKIFPNLANSFVFGPREANETRIDFASTCCEYIDPQRYSSYTAKYLFLKFQYGQNPLYFTDYLPEIRQLLEFAPSIRREGDYVLDTLKIGPGKVMCVHNRRTDFIPLHIATKLNDTVKSTTRIAQETGASQFMFFGDDRDFMGKLADGIAETDIFRRNAMYISQFTDALDLYISSQICDSFFITAATSTFGWWLAFFARDQSNVYYVLDSRMHEQKLPKRELFLKWWQPYYVSGSRR